MTVRVGIMGFGRIGRNIFRLLHPRDDMEVVAIVDIADPKSLEYLLKFDTVHGRFREPVRVEGNAMYAKGRQIRMITAREPGDVDWASHGVDVVIESTGQYRTRAYLQRHLDKGARHVILTVPPKQGEELDALVVSGVNDHVLKPEHRMISAASCTSNAVTPILKVLHENFGIEHAFMNSIHAYTNDQRLADVPGMDLRRSRAAAENIVPTSTYSPSGIGKILPELDGKLTGMALAVPVPDGSTVDLTVQMSKAVSREEINNVVRSAAESEYRAIVEYSEDPLVSSDVIGNSHSAIFDGLATMDMGEGLAKCLIWHDNGWGYSSRVVELVQRMQQMTEVAVGEA